MPNQLLDAVKTAKSIHDGDYSSLHGKSFVIRVNMKKKRRRKRVNKSNGNKTALTKLTSTVNNLTVTVNQLAEKIDNLGNDLRNEMNAGFKQVNSRLDYIVKTNNLKDLPKSK